MWATAPGRKRTNWPTAGHLRQTDPGQSPAPAPTLCVAVTSKGFIYSSTHPTGPLVPAGAAPRSILAAAATPISMASPARQLALRRRLGQARRQRDRSSARPNPTGRGAAWQQFGLRPKPSNSAPSPAPSTSLCVATGNDGRDRRLRPNRPRPRLAWRILGAPARARHGAGGLLPAGALRQRQRGRQPDDHDRPGRPARPAGGPSPAAARCRSPAISCPSASQLPRRRQQRQRPALDRPDRRARRLDLRERHPLRAAAAGRLSGGQCALRRLLSVVALCVAIGSQGQILAGTDPFDQAPPRQPEHRGRGKKHHKRHRHHHRRGPKRPRTKIATVQAPLRQPAPPPPRPADDPLPLGRPRPRLSLQLRPPGAAPPLPLADPPSRAAHGQARVPGQGDRAGRGCRAPSPAR